MVLPAFRASADDMRETCTGKIARLKSSCYKRLAGTFPGNLARGCIRLNTHIFIMV